MKFWVRSLRHPSGHHAYQLADATEAMTEGLRGLGYEVSETEGDRQLIIGGNLANAAVAKTIPDDSIIYNLEQAGSHHFSPEYQTLLRRCVAWDYSPGNAELMRREYGIDAKVVRHGYVPSMTRVVKVEPEIDVLFLGALNDRRRAVLQEMVERGLRVHHTNAAYGRVRDELLAKSKMLLNVHFYDMKIMEILRIGFGCANKVAVLTQHDYDSRSEADMLVACRSAPYHLLAHTAEMLVRADRMREDAALRGFEAFQKRDMVEILREAL